MINLLETLYGISALCLLMTVVTASRVIRADSTNVRERRRWALRWTAAAFICVTASAIGYLMARSGG